MIELDRTTRRLIEALQRHGRQSAQALAESVGMSATPVWRRKLGLAICVWAHVTLVRHTDGAEEDFERMVETCPEIMECASITGEADYLIKIVVPDMKAYDRFLQERLFKLKGISSIRSNVVLREVKYETALPLPPA